MNPAVKAPLKKCLEQYSYDIYSKPIGFGTYGTVYQGIDETNNQPVAIKVVPNQTVYRDEKHFSLFQREVSILFQIKSDYVVQILDIKRTSNNLYLVFEFCNGGNLKNELKNRSFTENEACSILKQIALAFSKISELEILNEKGQRVVLVHRDIKPDNILFHNGNVKVADFGFAKFMENPNPDDTNTKLLGTPFYMAPEVLNDKPYGVKCDIWSAGVLFYEVLFGDKPWTGNSIIELMKNIERKELMFPKEIRSSTKDLLIKMLKLREEDRPSWKEVYEHEALKEIK